MKMIKKISAMILALTMIMTMTVFATTTVPPTVDKSQMTASAISAVGKVTVNGVTLEGNDNMGRFWIDANGRTQAPVRLLVEAMGYTISYDKGVVTIPGGPNGDIKLVIGSNRYTVGGTDKEMDTVAAMIDGRTYVPLRFVAEALGAKVDAAGSASGLIIKITFDKTTERVINGVAQLDFTQCKNMQAFLKENTDIIDASEKDRWVMEYVTWVTSKQEAQLELSISYGGETGYSVEGLFLGEFATKQYELVYAFSKDTTENPDVIYAKLKEMDSIVSKGWNNDTGITKEASAWVDSHVGKTERIGNVNFTWGQYCDGFTISKASN